MKTTKILLSFLALFLAWGCTEDASLVGLEDQTKEDEAIVGETEESKRIKQILTYASELDYNWAVNFTPDQTAYNLLFDFREDATVESDSPMSDYKTRKSGFKVAVNQKNEVILRFSGATILQDQMIPKKYHESTLVVKSATDHEIECLGVKTGKEIVFKKATEQDVLALGVKQVWMALAEANALEGVLKNDADAFVARYSIDKEQEQISLTYIDQKTLDAQHLMSKIKIGVSAAQFTISWDPISVNGSNFSSLTLNRSDSSVQFDCGAKLSTAVKIIPEFIDKAAKQYNLGGKSLSGDAHPELWKVLSSKKFRSIVFYVYPDDLPLRVESFDDKGNTSNHLFVNDYVTSPKKAPVVDIKGDWVRFYKSQQGDFTKSLSENKVYPLDQAAVDLAPFLDFYFSEDGLYVIDQTDDRSAAFLLISPTSNLWVKVRQGLIPDKEEPVDPNANFLEDLQKQGMPMFGNFFENETKAFKLHFNLKVQTPQSEAELIWLPDEDLYSDGAYTDMAKSKLQYKTVKISATKEGVVTFMEPVKIGQAVFKGFTWGGGTAFTPNVSGISAGMRTPMKEFNKNEILDFFYTYTTSNNTIKYEAGSFRGQNNYLYTRLCMPTVNDQIVGVSPLGYLFYPHIFEGNGRSKGPNTLSIYSLSGKDGERNKERIDIKSYKYVANDKGGYNVSSQTYKMHIAGYKISGDHMIFTLGEVEGGMIDENAKGYSREECDELALPLKTLFFSEKGFIVYKAENCQLEKEKGKHYFYLLSPDAQYPYWIKVREM